MKDRFDAIYGRQSVDRKDSISIESQLEFCRRESRSGDIRVYTDRGYSGKNVDRPQFRALLGDVREGRVKRVIVYKLDRISRSILDFTNMMEMFQAHDVEFVSTTEKFDTSTPMGRAMLNICIVFAQFERETIQERVTDAYYSRCQRGFHMGGNACYGFKLVHTVIQGVNTKMMVPDEEAAAVVRHIFEQYAATDISIGELARRCSEAGILAYGKPLKRGFISHLLRNPIYAKADQDIYEFFREQGTEIVNDASDFVGTNGCYLYQGRDAQRRKHQLLKDQLLVLAPSQGLVPSDIWLRCRRKLMENTQLPKYGKGKNTWLVGKIKCGRCGYALMSVRSKRDVQYLRCSNRVDNKSCEGCGTMRTVELEEHVRVEMGKRVSRLRRAQANAGGEGPFSLEELAISLAAWGELDFEKRRQAADSLIEQVRATSEGVSIQWRTWPRGPVNSGSPDRPGQAGGSATRPGK